MQNKAPAPFFEHKDYNRMSIMISKDDVYPTKKSEAVHERISSSPACAGQWAEQVALAKDISGKSLAEGEKPQSVTINGTQEAETKQEAASLNNVQWLQWKLEQAFPGGDIQVHDTRGDDQHIAISIRSDVFQTLSRMAAHRLVYEALENMRCGQIHALSIKTHV